VKYTQDNLSTLTIWSRNVTTSTREPPTCAWIRADIWRQDGAICSKNRKIVPYHRCARIPRLTVSVPDNGSWLYKIQFWKKLFAMGFPYKHCNFWPLCLPVKMASKTVYCNCFLICFVSLKKTLSRTLLRRLLYNLSRNSCISISRNARKHAEQWNTYRLLGNILRMC